MQKGKIKIMQKVRVIILTTLITSMLFLLGANLNYKRALNEAKKGDRTDEAIELTMKRYGFNMDAMDTQEPSAKEKVTALFNL
jgi:hypothetical protein